MAMPIEQYLLEAGPDVYYTESFLSVLEDHLTFLRDHATTTEITLKPNDVNRFRGDLYGLLAEYRISPHMHYITARVNGYKSSLELTGTVLTLLVPNEDLVSMLAQTHQTVHSVS